MNRSEYLGLQYECEIAAIQLLNLHPHIPNLITDSTGRWRISCIWKRCSAMMYQRSQALMLCNFAGTVFVYGWVRG